MSAPVPPPVGGLPFPNVPFGVGVPNIPRSPAVPVFQTPQIGSSALSGQLWRGAQVPPVWGVFALNAGGQPTGNPVIQPDNIRQMDYNREYNIPSAPIQDGSFFDYNKVVIPFTNMLRMSKAGAKLADRQDFLNSIEAILGDLNLYAIVTPEFTYKPVNMLKMSLVRQEGRDAFFLTQVDVFFKQINQLQAIYTQSSNPNTQNAISPAALPFLNAGIVQTTTPSPGAASAVAAAGL